MNDKIDSILNIYMELEKTRFNSKGIKAFNEQMLEIGYDFRNEEPDYSLNRLSDDDLATLTYSTIILSKIDHIIYYLIGKLKISEFDELESKCIKEVVLNREGNNFKCGIILKNIREQKPFFNQLKSLPSLEEKRNPKNIAAWKPEILENVKHEFSLLSSQQEYIKSKLIERAVLNLANSLGGDYKTEMEKDLRRYVNNIRGWDSFNFIEDEFFTKIGKRL